jgi:Domain of unknown function (DUF5666)
MRRLDLSIPAALILMAVATVVQAQPTKTFSGEITAIAGDSVSVKAAGGQEMKFAVDAKTEVIAPGGTTKSNAAKTEGKGVTLTDVLKTGQAVEVRYHEAGMHAASIRALASVPSAPSAPSGPKAQTASGVVSAITGTSLTVKGSSEWTFTVDGKTAVTGTGVGTAAKKLTSEGKPQPITEFVNVGDTVSVTYHETGATKLASAVRITARKR